MPIWVIVSRAAMKYYQDRYIKEGSRKDMEVNDNEFEPLLTVREVARLLHVHSNTARRWSDQGLLRSYRISRRGDRRFRREDVTHFVAELTANEGDIGKVNSTHI